MIKYLELKERQLYDFIIHNEDIKNILNDEEFKEYLLKPENHYCFVWLVQDLSYSDLKLLLDNNYLEKIIKCDKYAIDKFNAIINSKNEVLLSANDKILEFIILNCESLYFVFSSFGIEIAEKLLDLIITKSEDKLFCLKYFNKNVQEMLFTVENIERLNKIPSFYNIFLTLSSNAILKLMKFENYKDIIRTLNKEQLINFTSKMKNIDFTKYLINDNLFLHNIASIEDPNYYRNVVNNLLINNYEIVEKIENYRLNYIKNLFNQIDNNGIFEIYKNLKNYIFKNGIDSKIYDKVPKEIIYSDFTDDDLLKLSNKRKFELLCEVYFKDYAKNVIFNLREIMKYDNYNIISEKRKKLYNMFLKFNELSQNEIDLLIENINKEDYSAILYEDIRNIKNATYNSYNDQFIKLDISTDLYSKKLSFENDIDVYYLDGQDFVACVHCGYFSRKDYNNKTISLSLIGTENIGVFDEDNLILGFNYLMPDKIMHVYNADSYTSKEEGSSRINKIYDAHDLLKQTYKYNEVLYSQKNSKNLSADYVVCMDKIDEESLSYAKSENIPILVINTKKYIISKGIVEEEDYQDSYIVRR